MAALERLWYGRSPLAWPLWPLSLLFGAVARQRRRRYLADVASGALWQPPVPVIVVGNISVGGTGKTPVVIALVEYLRQRGWRPGVVSRGYGGTPPTLPLRVAGSVDASQCGDEPLLVHLRTGCPVVVDPDRPRALRQLLASTDCNVVISDDGLQHYRLFRDVELAVVDGQRGLGNGLLLPAGPLREPPQRLREVDAVLLNGGSGEAPVLPVAAQRFDLQPTRFVSLDGARTLAVGGFGAGARVHALAGIGNPGRFFATLRSLGLDPREHPFADHHRYQPGDLAFGDGGPVVMTEKDAVKCRAFATPEHWYLAVEALLPPAFYGMLDARLAQALRRTAGATALS